MDRKKISIFLTVFVGSMMLFGALGLSMMKHNMQNACPLSAAMGTDCPQTASGSAMVLHHLEVLGQITQATFGGSPMKILSVAFLAGALLFVTRKILFLDTSGPGGFSGRHRDQHKTSSPITRMLFWSALHNKWGTTAPCRVYELTVTM